MIDLNIFREHLRRMFCASLEFHDSQQKKLAQAGYTTKLVNKKKLLRSFAVSLINVEHEQQQRNIFAYFEFDHFKQNVHVDDLNTIDAPGTSSGTGHSAPRIKFTSQKLIPHMDTGDL
jgi:hypothetical protein